MDENGDDSLMTKEYHVKIEEGFETNPWSVEDASAFLKYCCPECDYQILNLHLFSEHALEKHAKSIVLFGEEKVGQSEPVKEEHSEAGNNAYDLDDQNEGMETDEYSFYPQEENSETKTEVNLIH